MNSKASLNNQIHYNVYLTKVPTIFHGYFTIISSYENPFTPCLFRRKTFFEELVIKGY